jgi:hypothetical protein
MLRSLLLTMIISKSIVKVNTSKIYFINNLDNFYKIEFKKFCSIKFFYIIVQFLKKYKKLIFIYG